MQVVQHESVTAEKDRKESLCFLDNKKNFYILDSIVNSLIFINHIIAND